jgi:two-component system, LuxR family, response regulator FixJ
MRFYYPMYQSNKHDPDNGCPMASTISAPIIYVVDDDTDVLGSLRFLLETDGFDVRTFRNGTALLNGSTATEADCFVIDYKMPAMSGIDLANRLRNRNLDAPVILITGYPDENIEEKAAAAGIRHVLLKPHLEESLASRIRGAIQESLASGR